MKLLIVTQVLDKNHPILGFFHRWVEEFAVHCEKVHVICLEEGDHMLPANVIVHSLGKEKGNGKFGYLFKFYSLIFSLRKDYDNVFVHMNQIYVILGAPFWRAFGKKVGLWYAHGSTPASLKLAEKMTNVIFTCSEDSFKVSSKKVVVTGHGIDSNHFKPSDFSKTKDLITVGRITESKNLITLIEVIEELQKTHPVKLTIVGTVVTESECKYEEKLRDIVAEKQLESIVEFVGRVPQDHLPQTLGQAKVFVTAAQNGSLDKAMLEAMACGLSIVSMAPGSTSLPLGTAQTMSKEAFLIEIKKVLESLVFKRPEYVAYVSINHSLVSLIPRILNRLS